MMARPTIVSDVEIIEAGEKISATQAVNATRLWNECGRHGRPGRLLAVWEQHEVSKHAHAEVNKPSDTGLPIPEKAQRLANSLKSDVASGVDQVLLSIYAAVEESLRGRYQAEMAGMRRTREDCYSELHDAHQAMEELSDAKSAAEDRVTAVEAARNEALITCNVGEALRAAAVEENARLVDRLRQADEDLKHELFERGEAKAAAARVEVAGEALRRALEGTTVSFQAAQGELAQAMLASASLRDDNVRQGEAIGLKDLEIGRLRQTAAAAEASNKAWMERALIAERPPTMLPASPCTSIENPARTRVRRRRKRTGPDRLGTSDPDSPERNGSAEPLPVVEDQQNASNAMVPQ